MNTELSVNTDYVEITGPASSGSYEALALAIEAGLYPGWETLAIPVGFLWEVQLFNQQEIELQGLVAEDLHWDSETVRIEQAEPARAFFGAFKDPYPAEYGFMREYHLFTTKKMDTTALTALLDLQNPLIPGMLGSSLTRIN